MRRQVVDRVRALAGMHVPEVAVLSNGCTRPPRRKRPGEHGMSDSESTAPEEDPPPPQGPGGFGGRRRFWSAAGSPRAWSPLLTLVVAGAFLYDVAAVRAHRSALDWRRELARQLAERPWTTSGC
ncbi:hypothetical protein GCM10023238_02000 [Streptomyces heliomycini]